MNTQHHTEDETVDTTYWEMPGAIFGIIAYGLLGIFAGSIALQTSNITFVPIIVAITGSVVAVTAYLVELHHARQIRSKHAAAYRAAAGTWLFYWLGTVLVGLIVSLLLAESFYNDAYSNSTDGSVAHVMGGLIGVGGFAVWSYLVFTRPGGTLVKWIAGSLLYLVAQAMPIGFAMTIGWRDAGHFF